MNPCAVLQAMNDVVSSMVSPPHASSETFVIERENTKERTEARRDGQEGMLGDRPATRPKRAFKKVGEVQAGRDRNGGVLMEDLWIYVLQVLLL